MKQNCPISYALTSKLGHSSAGRSLYTPHKTPHMQVGGVSIRMEKAQILWNEYCEQVIPFSPIEKQTNPEQSDEPLENVCVPYNVKTYT